MLPYLSALDWLAMFLCAYRLTQLVVWDEISEPLVSWISERSEWLRRLFGCAHCTGFWASLFTVVVTAAAIKRGWWPVRMLTWAFAVAGMVSIIEHATGWLTPVSDDIFQENAGMAGREGDGRS